MFSFNLSSQLNFGLGWGEVGSTHNPMRPCGRQAIHICANTLSLSHTHTHTHNTHLHTLSSAYNFYYYYYFRAYSDCLVKSKALFLALSLSLSLSLSRTHVYASHSRRVKSSKVMEYLNSWSSLQNQYLILNKFFYC